MSEQPTIRERIEKSDIQPLKDLVKEIDNEQQDWTPEYIKHLFATCSSYEELSERFNAALAAEREISKEWFDKWGETKAELTTERQRREQAERLCEAKDRAWEKLEDDLLSAQAAIEKHDAVAKPRLNNLKMLDAIHKTVLDHSGNKELADQIWCWLRADSGKAGVAPPGITAKTI